METGRSCMRVELMFSGLKLLRLRGRTNWLNSRNVQPKSCQNGLVYDQARKLEIQTLQREKRRLKKKQLWMRIMMRRKKRKKQHSLKKQLWMRIMMRKKKRKKKKRRRKKSKNQHSLKKDGRGQDSHLLNTKHSMRVVASIPDFEFHFFVWILFKYESLRIMSNL